MSFQVKSRLYLGLTGVKWSQYATYFHLGPIQGLYKEDMLVIYHDFEGNLPFTGILQEVYGLPYATSTAPSPKKKMMGRFARTNATRTRTDAFDLKPQFSFHHSPLETLIHQEML